MPSLEPIRFAVVKFVVDPIRDEPLNIGVVATHAGGLECRFVDTLSRYKNALADDDIKNLSVAIKFLRSSLDRSINKTLDALHEELLGQLRLSNMMGGISEDVQAFIDDQFDLYVGNVPEVMRARPAQDRIKIRERIRSAIGKNGRVSEQFSLAKKRVRGTVGRHSFDFGILNGKATLMNAISFQTREEYALNEAKALTWAASDTKKCHRGKVEIATIIAPPLEITQAYEEGLNALRSETSIIDFNTDLEPFVDRLLNKPHVGPIPNDWLEAPSPALVEA